MMWPWRSQPAQPANKTISFVNLSRTYDVTRRAVHFWGYDRTMESSFFVTADALRRLSPSGLSDALDLLRTFDIHRDRIHAVATRVYARGHKGSYRLDSTDF